MPLKSLIGAYRAGAGRRRLRAGRTQFVVPFGRGQSPYRCARKTVCRPVVRRANPARPSLAQTRLSEQTGPKKDAYEWETRNDLARDGVVSKVFIARRFRSASVFGDGIDARVGAVGDDAVAVAKVLDHLDPGEAGGLEQGLDLSPLIPADLDGEDALGAQDAGDFGRQVAIGLQA